MLRAIFLVWNSAQPTSWARALLRAFPSAAHAGALVLLDLGPSKQLFQAMAKE